MSEQPTEQIMVMTGNGYSPSDWIWFAADEYDKAVEYAKRELAEENDTNWAVIYRTTRIEEFEK